jgi:ElaB/YqjD/DUF883 family membrane-anchored ribosome-binding protein
MDAREDLMTTDSEQVTRAKLMADLRVLASDTEQLLKATASQTGQHVAQARAQAEDSLRAARARVAHLQDLAMAKTRAVGRATDGYVRANPWQIIAVCVAAGLVLGFLAGSSRDADS